MNTNKLERPFVSAMIVFRNEEKYISKCLQSLLEQDYPTDRFEILLVDGCSNDDTLNNARKTELDFRSTHHSNSYPIIKYLNNKKQILASGWNLGIKSAQGVYVFRIDAHGFCNQNFISESVNTILGTPDAICVGGTIVTEALTKRGKLVASVLSSPFGVGNSKFRYTTKAQYVDTVAFGLYKREIFEEIGYFDESLKRNQDNDMHMRIRDAGYKFYLNPSIKATYHPRETIKGMLKQGFNNGYWNIVTFKKSPKTLSLRHLIPLGFVLGLLSLFVLSLIDIRFLYLLISGLTFHLLLGFIFSVKYHHKWSNIFIIPFLYLLLHLSYGFGSVSSIVKIGGKK